MDIITTAIQAAIVLGITSGATEVAKTAVVDASNGLKALIRKKLGKENEVTKAISDLETKPNSTGRKVSLQEEVTAAKLDQDQEIVAAAKALIELIKASPTGQEVINQTVIGDKNIFSGTGDINITNK